MKRFEVWLVNLDPTIGSEIKKTRPAVIVSPDELNEHLNTVAVVPLTQGRAYPFRIATKVKGKDGVAARAFENAIYYVFANSVGRQGGGRWSAGDSKIVAPNEQVLALADNESEAVLVATLDLAKATRSYAERSMEHPRFLAADWKRMVAKVRKQAAAASAEFDLP